MPSSPLAPMSATVLIAVPPLLQVLGAVAGTAVSPITWTGTEVARSPAM